MHSALANDLGCLDGQIGPVDNTGRVRVRGPERLDAPLVVWSFLGTARSQENNAGPCRVRPSSATATQHRHTAERLELAAAHGRMLETRIITPDSAAASVKWRREGRFRSLAGTAHGKEALKVRRPMRRLRVRCQNLLALSLYRLMVSARTYQSVNSIFLSQ